MKVDLDRGSLPTIGVHVRSSACLAWIGSGAYLSCRSRAYCWENWRPHTSTHLLAHSLTKPRCGSASGCEADRL